MATVPVPVSLHASGDTLSKPPARRRSVLLVAGVVLAILGILGIWPTALSLWSLWVTDPLKSIGGLVPPVSLMLALRAWRSLEWEQNGSFWGLALLGAIALAVHLRDGAVLELVVSPSWSLTLPPHSLVAFGYASGVALLLGGASLWKQARFPIALMLLVNPVPHFFSRAVDLPLQHAAATVARHLAHSLGQTLTPDQLYLMFTPQFGMFIAPGCDGIRGAVAMGLLALVAGHLYRFRWRSWVALVIGAVLLGYVFNLLRLCALVLYYVLALHWPWLQHHAEGADYAIGGGLFFVASILLFAGIRRFAVEAGPEASQRPCSGPLSKKAAPLRLGGFALLTLLSFLPYVMSARRQGAPLARAVPFPAQVGDFRLQRTWTETLASGQVLFEWATYTAPEFAGQVSLGISPVLGAHDTLLCHTARGEPWLWHGPLPLQSLDGSTMFSGTFFSEGTAPMLEASTLCSAAGCGQWTSERRHLGLVYSRFDPAALQGTERSHPVPVLLQAEANHPLEPEKARLELTRQLQQFARATSFGAFTYRYFRP